MIERIYQLSRKMTRNEVVVRLSCAMIDRIKKFEQEHRRFKALLIDDVNAAITDFEKQFNIVDSNEMREIELMTNLEDFLIEDTDAVLSRSDFDTKMNIMSSEARDEDDVLMNDMNSSRRV